MIRIIAKNSENKNASTPTKIGVLGDYYVQGNPPHDLISNVFEQEIDYLLLNIEGCVSDRKTLKARAKCGPPLKMKASAIAPYKKKNKGKMLAMLSNNHVCDYGSEGLEETLTIHKELGLEYAGAGRNDKEAWEVLRKPLLGNEGKQLAIINFSEGEDDSSAKLNSPGVSGYEPARVASLISREKKAGNTVIVIFHGGREQVVLPAPYVQKMFRSFAEIGADCVIGHHSHVPQPWELWEDVPIIYSLGNSHFDYGNPTGFGRFGMSAFLEISGRGSIENVELKLFTMSKSNQLHLLPENHQAYGYLRKGAMLVSNEAHVENAWKWTALSESRQMRMSILKTALLSSLASIRFRRKAAGLRGLIGTPAHQHFITEKLSLFLSKQPESEYPSELMNFLEEQNNDFN